MKSLIKLEPLFSSKLFRFSFSNSHSMVRFSSLSSEPSKANEPRKKQRAKKVESSGSSNIGSLFSEITEILGSESLVADGNSSGISVTEENEKMSDCTKSACENTDEKSVVVLGESDVSSVVNEVTQIVRSEIGLDSMEERLEEAGIEFGPEIVDKVLKRLFKVPNLAMRFFNWVKLRDGFSHTAETYNTMLFIAGEAKEIGLVERLVLDMEKNSCEKDVKTWTILIMCYGKARMTARALAAYDEMVKSGREPDQRVYKMMIRSLCEARKAEIAMEFYKEMARKEFVGLDMKLYKMLLSCVARSGDTEAVRLVMDDMIKVSQIPVRVVYGCVLKSFCISGRIRDALELIRDLKDKNVAFGHEHFETLLKGLFRADRINDALEIFEIMKSKQLVDGKVYGIIIGGYLRKNDISTALDFFQSMKESGYCPTASTYTELMQNLFRLKRYEEGFELYTEMLEQGVEPDIVAITAVVAGYVRANHVSKAWEVFRSMEAKGIRPTWKSYSVFIKELCRISNTDEIFNVLNEMRASDIFIGDEIFHWVISHMQRKGDIENMERVRQMQRTCKLDVRDALSTNKPSMEQENNVDLVDKSEPEVTVFRQLEPLSSAYNEKDLQEISRILSSPLDWLLIQEALEKSTVEFTPELVVEVLRNCNTNGYLGLQFFAWVGKQSKYSHTSETYNVAVKLAGRGKDFRHMRNLFHEMRRNRFTITPDTWTIMIMQYGRIGLTDIALNTFQEMKNSKCNPTASTYKYLIISLCGRKGRKVIEAIKLFKEMVRSGFAPNKELVESYLACLCEVGKLSDARKCIDSIQKFGFTVSLSYSLYIRALCRTGRIEEALELADEVKTERASLDQFTYGSIFHGLLRKGRVAEALEKMDSMKKAGIEPTVHVYTSLIVHHLKEKRIEEALETLQKMKDAGCEPTIVTHSVFIRGYVEMGNAAKAWNIFSQMKEKGPLPDFQTYSMFISCLCKVGKSEEAVKLIDEMLESGIVPSTVNFTTVFHGLNREGKQCLAQTVLQKKLSLVRKRKFLT